MLRNQLAPASLYQSLDRLLIVPQFPDARPDNKPPDTMEDINHKSSNPNTNVKKNGFEIESSKPGQGGQTHSRTERPPIAVVLETFSQADIRQSVVMAVEATNRAEIPGNPSPIEGNEECEVEYPAVGHFEPIITGPGNDKPDETEGRDHTDSEIGISGTIQPSTATSKEPALDESGNDGLDVVNLAAVHSILFDALSYIMAQRMSLECNLCQASRRAKRPRPSFNEAHQNYVFLRTLSPFNPVEILLSKSIKLSFIQDTRCCGMPYFLDEGEQSAVVLSRTVFSTFVDVFPEKLRFEMEDLVRLFYGCGVASCFPRDQVDKEISANRAAQNGLSLEVVLQNSRAMAEGITYWTNIEGSYLEDNPNAIRLMVDAQEGISPSLRVDPGAYPTVRLTPAFYHELSNLLDSRAMFLTPDTSDADVARVLYECGVASQKDPHPARLSISGCRVLLPGDGRFDRIPLPDTSVDISSSP
ncbi:hypothetical protein NMY22_g9116 [Coprinellus aureogranulatus]|nr:hypothetical protein NMY22_g9116 [Coprinellus aureogranulatus]